ncbi:GNAT family N-acetyltransferase [Rhizobium sp. LjRoot98]|uniref:GNAT family N-acetyltransferase n=1 Tax=unclassified Rhizobium TaxID=2613769 RepID=UPI000713D56A|nr:MULTISPECIES: GNAT family N-acetyltransferase [unclassified Rhizobium]KQV34229.1 acetyltransferase [Rhizobium sp. Root1204]KQY17642.1 acetyltransferase [Rhizobium sp. Root1334]KRC13944.1 acetyltransferase [Rhizobium sp. Root73]
MKRPVIEVISENASEQDIAPVIAVLDQHAALHMGEVEEKPDFAILARDPDTQAVVGGLYGMDSFGWAFVKYLAVVDEYRGQGLGSRLLAEAEAIARTRGYVGVWLDTFEFQAKPFYEKLGYTVFGELEGAPNVIPQYFLKKRF